jgi:hypothetical protein
MKKQSGIFAYIAVFADTPTPHPLRRRQRWKIPVNW